MCSPRTVIGRDVRRSIDLVHGAAPKRLTVLLGIVPAIVSAVFNAFA
jgi:hypothetical protein